MPNEHHKRSDSTAPLMKNEDRSLSEPSEYNRTRYTPTYILLLTSTVTGKFRGGHFFSWII